MKTNGFDFGAYLNLGALLLRAGKVTDGQLARAIEEQKRLGGGNGRNPLIGVVLVELGFCTHKEIQAAVERQEQMRVPKLDKTAAAQDILDDALDNLMSMAKSTAETTKTTTRNMRAVHLDEELSGPIMR